MTLQDTLPAVAALFSSPEPGRQPITFSWRLVHRKGRPFLLLPTDEPGLTNGLELYAAQRPVAKLGRAALPRLLQTPAAGFFPLLSVQADATSGFIQFLAQQAGVPAAQLLAPAIKLGEANRKNSRLVLLLNDAAGNPIRVVKVGLPPRGRQPVEQEAELLSHLPQGLIGGTSITGSFSCPGFSAVATAFFAGKSLTNDLGIEKLFHEWLNIGPRQSLEKLSSWQELEARATEVHSPFWPPLRQALQGHQVRTTLFHGDFTPWNVRMLNLENIRAFDWERGHLQGIPAWDWFHFIVQTSVLAQRHSPQRVAAELEQLIASPRFATYAQTAGISPIIEPLLLAYLLHQELVIRPQHGSRLSRRLFELLWERWYTKTHPCGAKVPLPSRRAVPALRQLQGALTDLNNLFWEPHLSPSPQPSLLQQTGRHWGILLAALAWVVLVACLQRCSSPRLLFIPFYFLPCIYLTLRVDRRLGFLAATLAGIAGPLARLFAPQEPISLDIACWNIAMRVLTFESMVILLDRFRKQSQLHPPSLPELHPTPAGQFSNNWAVVVMTTIYFVLVLTLDANTNPHLIFLPLYMLGCLLLTLALNWYWGTLAALVASVAVLFPTSSSQLHGYQNLVLQFWNILMRFSVFELGVVLLRHVRHENILFSPPPPANLLRTLSEQDPQS